MKILIPTYCFSDSFADNVRVTLETMGHDVKVIGMLSIDKYLSLIRRVKNKLSEFIPYKYSYFEERDIVKIVKEYKPDLFLSLTQPIHPEILLELGKYCRGRRVLWWGDAPANSPKWGVLDKEWDFVYMKDRNAVEKLRLVGRNAFFLHEAMNPLWHKPVALQKTREIVVAGTCYAFRQSIVLRLMEDGLAIKIYGPPPPMWADTRIVECHSGRYIVCEEKSRVFGEGMACLNTFSLSEGDSLNCRSFEIAGAGGLQIIEYRPSINECFDPEKELLVFKSYEELLGHIDRASRFPEEMQVIRVSGANRALADHTYLHRLNVILKNI